ncbi:hypothetical protein D3C77_438060 [compost metagenome]
MLANLLLQLRFGLKQMLQVLVDHLKFIGMLGSQIGLSLSHLIKQSFDWRIHAAGTDPCEQNGQQQQKRTDINRIGADHIRLLRQTFYGSHR